MTRRGLHAALLLLAGVARAGEPTEAAVAPRIEERVDAPVRTWVNLRAGATTTARRPELCLDVSPLEFLSLEACGTGSGFLHRDPDPETAHFRSSFRLHKWQSPVGQLEPMLGFGFAELQLGEDQPGFQFGGVGPNGVETAGPEGTASLRALYPLGGGFELVGNLTTGLIYAPHAPRLVRPQPRWQPFGTLTFGVGF